MRARSPRLSTRSCVAEGTMGKTMGMRSHMVTKPWRAQLFPWGYAPCYIPLLSCGRGRPLRRLAGPPHHGAFSFVVPVSIQNAISKCRVIPNYRVLPHHCAMSPRSPPPSQRLRGDLPASGSLPAALAALLYPSLIREINNFSIFRSWSKGVLLLQINSSSFISFC